MQAAIILRQIYKVVVGGNAVAKGPGVPGVEVGDGVIAEFKFEYIVSVAARQSVVACLTIQGIIAKPAFKRVVTNATIQVIGPAAACQ